ncbi:rhodanese-like domain-containing protein [Gracilibacillus thailandensis]|uniref:Rhodanese-like domain-containing protein n=1 Tax=Gracilibacillus thailandensis TaxID=563735 RepID=A0A6N7QV92_9BACI|nr:rhodanese-like domain-containing protein [Gracilibacillus thailandensis]MRI66013.1 rhodanese-like domain-containing protein [Gracilibacillus thailandensis]
MKEISSKQLQKMIEDKQNLNIIDVREVEEVAHGKIPKAIHIPLGLLEFRKHELDKSKEYIIVCRSGGRSARAASFLEDQGFHVTNLIGGMLAWEGETE